MASGTGGAPANDNFKLQKDSKGAWLTPFDQEQLPSPGGSLGGYPVAVDQGDYKSPGDPLGIMHGHK